MRNVLPALADDGEGLCLAVVVRVDGPSLKPVGAAMVVHDDGRLVGNISAGCVEAAVVAAAEDVRASGMPVRLHFGPADGDLFEVGTPCGGSLHVLVSRPSADDWCVLRAAAAELAADRDVRLLLVVANPDVAMVGRWRAVAADEEGPDAGMGVDVETAVIRLLPRRRLLVFGAIDIAAATAQLGQFMGFRVTVCDPRSDLLTPERFPGVDERVIDWPHRYLAAEAAAGRLGAGAAVLVLTHDPKLDLPLLHTALPMPELAYVGALGSRRTHADRMVRLAEMGVSARDLTRLSGPVGLDLGASTPQETALSILAEVLALRTGGSGRRLADTEGPVHSTTAPPLTLPCAPDRDGLRAGQA